MNNEVLNIIDSLEREKGVQKEVLFEESVYTDHERYKLENNKLNDLKKQLSEKYELLDTLIK